MPRAPTRCAATHCPQPALVGAPYCADHRPRTRMSPRKWSALVSAVVARDRGICQLCGKPGATSADHITRVKHGGTDEMRNLRAAHVQCNLRRG